MKGQRQLKKIQIAVHGSIFPPIADQVAAGSYGDNITPPEQWVAQQVAYEAVLGHPRPRPMTMEELRAGVVIDGPLDDPVIAALRIAACEDSNNVPALLAALSERQKRDTPADWTH